jgi:hypothetical protein
MSLLVCLVELTLVVVCVRAYVLKVSESNMCEGMCEGMCDDTTIQHTPTPPTHESSSLVTLFPVSVPFPHATTTTTTTTPPCHANSLRGFGSIRATGPVPSTSLTEPLISRNGS